MALVVGAGDATGSAIGARFAREGYIACLTARKEADVVDQIEKERGPIEVMVFNIGANVPSSILKETGRKYMKIWELKEQDGILNPEHIAENDWYLHTQPQDAWTFEMDLRPYMETW